MSHRSVLGAEKKVQMSQRSDKTVQCEATYKTQNRHLVKQNQLLMQYREIDPDIRWMAVGIIMITTATNMKASATKQQPKPQEKKQKSNKKNVNATKNSKNQLDV